MQTDVICSKLDEVIHFLKPLLPLTNCHMVNFITESLFNKHVPDSIKREVESIALDDLYTVFWRKWETRMLIPSPNCNSKHVKLEDSSPLVEFLDHGFKHSLPSLGVTVSTSELLQRYKCGEVDGFHLDQFMSHKKKHEVEVMSRVTSALARLCDVSHVLDIGGGKGYLSSILALHFKLGVLGVDASQITTRGAEKRTEKLQRMWTGLCRRAEESQNGNRPSRRRKRHGTRTVATEVTSHAAGTDMCHGSTSGNCDSIASVASQDLGSCSQTDTADRELVATPASDTKYKQTTAYVTDKTNIAALIEEHFEDTSSGLAVVGLHTCGDLSPTCLRIFANSPDAHLLCNVGCCYHLVEEEFPGSKFWAETVPEATEFGFPMSSFLQAKKFFLGRNARMLASQSVDRISFNNKVPALSLFYRALLQALLVSKFSDTDLPQGQVGRLAQKCKNFSEYVHSAVAKMDLNVEIPDAEIWDHYNKYLPHYNQLQAFFMLRVSLAPVIECVILLDRLLYLFEQGLEDAYLVQLFDPVISPRCYAIVATKGSSGARQSMPHTETGS